VILDSQVRAKYGFGSLAPGQEWPEGFGATADTV